MLRAALLLALDHHGDVERQLAGDRLEGAAGLDEGHGLAFVVAGAARDDDFAPAVERFDARLERRRLPQIERVDRLHVVMAVEQDARRLPARLGRRRLPSGSCRSRPDGRRSDARWSRSRGRADPPRHARRRRGNAAHRPDRSTPTGCARARTADRGWRRGRGRCGREPRAKLRMPSWVSPSHHAAERPAHDCLAIDGVPPPSRNETKASPLPTKISPSRSGFVIPCLPQPRNAAAIVARIPSFLEFYSAGPAVISTPFPHPSVACLQRSPRFIEEVPIKRLEWRGTGLSCCAQMYIMAKTCRKCGAG